MAHLREICNTLNGNVKETQHKCHSERSEESRWLRAFTPLTSGTGEATRRHLASIKKRALELTGKIEQAKVRVGLTQGATGPGRRRPGGVGNGD